MGLASMRNCWKFFKNSLSSLRMRPCLAPVNTFLLATLLVSCCVCQPEESMVVSGKPVVNFERCKAMHEEKLRRHFIGGCKCKEDVSSLIIGTMAISAELKRLGKMSDARKFESYVDVLMFGNQTIDESLDDVMQLVRGRRPI